MIMKVVVDLFLESLLSCSSVRVYTGEQERYSFILEIAFAKSGTIFWA